MGKDIRVTLRRRSSYATRGNRTKTVKTPGGIAVSQAIKKKGTNPKCGDCGVKLPGIPAMRPREYKKVSNRVKSVSRAYGGSRCATCIRQRVVRAFLIEEQKNVKLVLAQQQKKSKK